MSFYYTIDSATPEGRRTAQRLLALRDKLASEVPVRTIADTLLLATWNIREFDSEKYGTRPDEALFYIAEIISHFDLVAVQEVRDDLQVLRRLLRILGPDWHFLATDLTEGAAGNGERLAFLYDGRKIRFANIAGEIVLPEVTVKGQKVRPAQLARSPFLVSFQAGWFKFQICTVHIVYGKQVADSPERIEEIRQVARFLARRAANPHEWTQNLILLGDFNIFDPKNQTFAQIIEAGFTVPAGLQQLPANAARDKYYDQIAFRLQNPLALCAKPRCGVFDYYAVVYRDPEDMQEYAPVMARLHDQEEQRQKKKLGAWRYGDWRTYQMSDHLPMWIELRIDFGREYLESRSVPPT